MRPPLAAAALPLLLIVYVAQVGPCGGLPTPAVSGRPRHRADDLIAGTDFLSVFIGSALPRSASSSAQQPHRTRPRPRDSTTAPEDIGFGARLAPKSPSTTTATATPTTLSTTTENPLSSLVTDRLSTRRQEYDVAHSKGYSETVQPSTEPTGRIEDAASDLKYRTFPPAASNTVPDVSLPPDTSISVVTDIVTSKQELISLTAINPLEGDQHTSDGILSASRITNFYVQHHNDESQSHPHTSYDSSNPRNDFEQDTSHLTTSNSGYNERTAHGTGSVSSVHYQAAPHSGSAAESSYRSNSEPSASYHTVTVHDQRQGHDFQVHSTHFPQSTSNPWFSTRPTEATQIVVNHPGQATPRVETSTVQQVISVRVSSSVVQGPSSPPYTVRSKPFSSSPENHNQYFHSDETAASSDSNESHSKSGSNKVTQYLQHSLPQPADSSQEQAIEDQQQVVPTTLVTEDQPAATALQRSQFNVEESSPSAGSSLHGTQQRRGHSYHDDGSDQTIATVVEVPAPGITYETHVTSPTSNSRIQFYSGPPPNQPEPLKRHGTWTPQRGRKSFSQHEQQEPQQPNQQQRHEQYTQTQDHHQRQQQAHAEPSEANYEQPEENYEVDEQVSVVTNGRAHGVQHQPDTTQPSPQAENPQVDGAGNKAGFVVEDRGFRRYRVEERTPDGFIVGEYGVVNSEGDPLRAVRYTADGTAPTKLIDQALSHFLSL